MTPAERRAASIELTLRSDHEFKANGNTMVAAELLWGAVTQGLMAIGTINQWQFNGHSFYQFAAGQLATQEPNIPWGAEVAAANKLHIHFYHNNLTANDLQIHRSIAKRLLTNIDQYLATQGV